jgi:hypothetical protein
MPLQFPYDDPLALATLPPPHPQGGLHGAPGMAPSAPSPTSMGQDLSLGDVVSAVNEGRGFSTYGGLVGQALGLGPSNAIGALGMGYGLGSAVTGFSNSDIGQAISTAMGFGVPGAVIGGPVGLGIGSGLGAVASLADVNEGLVGRASNALGLGALGMAMGGPTGGLIGAIVGAVTGGGDSGPGGMSGAAVAGMGQDPSGGSTSTGMGTGGMGGAIA